MWFEWTILGLAYVCILGIKAWALCWILSARDSHFEHIVGDTKKRPLKDR